jgi:hypothetical protein
LKLTPGNTVLYKLTQDDLESIMAKLHENEGQMVADPRPGDMCPAVVVRTHDDGSVNLKVLLDGDPDLWITDVLEGKDYGQYQVKPILPADRPMVFRFGRLWSFGNFENLKADIERVFPAGTSAAEAMSTLSLELENARGELIRRQKLMSRYQELQEHMARNKSVSKLLEAEQSEFNQIRQNLGIKDDIAPELAAVGTGPAAAS